MDFKQHAECITLAAVNESADIYDELKDIVNEIDSIVPAAKIKEWKEISLQGKSIYHQINSSSPEYILFTAIYRCLSRNDVAKLDKKAATQDGCYIRAIRCACYFVYEQLTEKTPVSKNTFKVGDRVIGTDSTKSFYKQAGTVINLREDDAIDFKDDYGRTYNGYYSSRFALLEPATPATPAKEPSTMNVSIETITFVTAPGIASVDVRKLSATELSTAVRSIEDEIKSLEAIEAKPLSVIERISDLRKGLSDLVKAADDAHRAKQSK